jgi:hypothetical protein
MLCLTSLIIWMHGAIPHVHASELSEDQHQAIHTSEPEDVLSIFSFIFHEYTEDGAFEHICVSSQETLVITAEQEDFYCVPALGIVSGALHSRLLIYTFSLPDAPLIASRKFRWDAAVRPPPLK